MQRRGMTMANRLLARRAFINHLQWKGNFNQLFTIRHIGNAPYIQFTKTKTTATGPAWATQGSPLHIHTTPAPTDLRISCGLRSYTITPLCNSLARPYTTLVASKSGSRWNGFVM